MSLMKELLDDLNKDHDLDTMLLRCAEWTADEIGQFHFKPYPMRPEEMRFVDEIPEGEIVDTRFYETHPQILNYIHARNHAYWENKALSEWLLDCRARLLTAGDVERTQLIDNKLKERKE